MTVEHQATMREDAHPAAVGAVPGVLLIAIEEDLLPVHQGGQLLGQPGGGPAPAPHIQPLSERSHQPAAAICSADIAMFGSAEDKILLAGVLVQMSSTPDQQGYGLEFNSLGTGSSFACYAYSQQHGMERSREYANKKVRGTCLSACAGMK